MNLNLQICCNDHRNGSFQGWMQDAVLSLPNAEIELHGWRVTVYDDVLLRIGRVKVEVLGEKEWYGNWCWNGYAVNKASLLKVANYLKRRGWDCHCGPTEIYERWKEAAPITVEEWDGWYELFAAEGVS